jgi:glucuronate isomerase
MTRRISLKEFMGRAFMLTNSVSERLYYEYAEQAPIFDFHNHLPPKEIYENKNYSSITELWLKADHYKWRAMRAAGIDEHYITGDAGDLEKFKMWAKVVERLPGSPLYHWANLELKRYFDIHTPLTSKNAVDIFNKCGQMLKSDSLRPVSILQRSGVKAACTTDEPYDDLLWHVKIKEEGLPFQVLPTFRPDKFLRVDNKVWLDSVQKLAAIENTEIRSIEALKDALQKALVRFKEVGCIATDMGFSRFAYTNDPDTEDVAEKVFEKAIKGEVVSGAEADAFESSLLLFLGKEYSRMGLCMQLHVGAMRNVNTKMFERLGPDSGYDNMGIPTDPRKLAAYLNDLRKADSLPRTILYGLNPADLPVMTGIAVSFCDGECPGKVQVGSAWWFNDTAAGMRAQLNESAQAGLLQSFVGMVTDSRSFSSFVRHEYFRRILCSFLGDLVENGEYPADYEVLGDMVRDVCYYNAVRFFNCDN